MKIKWSPLVASASGTTADAVAASWKGIQYIRKHVIPHNPQSAAQTLVRESLARCVLLWRSLHADIKTWLNTYAVDYRMSGFNTFMSKNRAAEQADTALFPVPNNPYVDAVVGAAAETGAGASGDIDVTWTPAGSTALDTVWAFARDITTNKFTGVNSAIDGDGALTLGGLTAGETFNVYIMYGDSVGGSYGTPLQIDDIDSKA